MNSQKKPILSYISTETAVSFVWFAILGAMISVSITVWAALRGNVGVSRWSLIDAAIMLGLAVGLIFKKYWCAWALIGYWVLNQGVKYAETGHKPGSFANDFLWFYLLGVVGVVILRSRQSDSRKSAPLPPPEATSPEGS